MKKKNRIIAILLAVMVLFVMLYSALFIVAEVGHDCTGENCPVCYQINVCQNTLKNLSFVVCAVVFSIAFTHILCRNTFVCTVSVQDNSLVALKVKLSD